VSVTDGLVTPRLRLRQWRRDDYAPFAALNSDPEVMEHFLTVLSGVESDALADRCARGIAERGWGWWAVERTDSGQFIGFVGLSPVGDEFPFGPAVEIGWRLARSQWGHGYATEAARAALSYGFETLGLDEIVAFTSVANLRSERVMVRLGMTRDPAEDFDHPRLPRGHRVSRHVLYRLCKGGRFSPSAGAWG